MAYKTSLLPGHPDNYFNLPALTAGVQNQGLNNYVPRDEATILKNVISISANGANTGATFYQSKEFTVLQDSYAIQYMEHTLTEIQYLFMVTLISKSISSAFEWTNKAGWEKVKKRHILLPIKNNEIDFDFMESFIAELETQRVAELVAYLKTTGLSSYELTQEEEDALNKLQNSKLNFDSFRIASSYMIRKKVITVDNRGLFDIRPTKKKINANSVVFDGSFNYVARGESQNGIRGKIDFDTQYLNDENTISFGQDTATMFYQKEKYFTGDKIQIFSLNKKYGILNNKIALFLISSMNKTFSLYSWGSNSFSLETISNENIYLPITSTQKIDFEYMETLISAIQKLVIKDVVEYTDKKIKATKEVISNKNR